MNNKKEQKTVLEGGCFCGNIRYQILSEDLTTVNCHCGMCRRISGAPYVSWVVVPENQFTFLAGKAKDLKSSDDGTRSFCADCGTPLTWIHTNHPQIAITLGSLDDPNAVIPTLEIYTDSKLGWTDQIGDLKKTPVS